MDGYECRLGGRQVEGRNGSSVGGASCTLEGGQGQLMTGARAGAWVEACMEQERGGQGLGRRGPGAAELLHEEQASCGPGLLHKAAGVSRSLDFGQTQQRAGVGGRRGQLHGEGIHGWVRESCPHQASMWACQSLGAP
eukprot:1018124-Pelagomonas_calceolata.AAC.1